MRRRLMVRLSNEYLLDYANILSEMFDGDLVKGLVFLATAQANVSHIGHDPADFQRYGDLDDLRPDRLRRPIRPYALALSLGLPRERVRRKTAALVAEGFLTATGAGVIASAEIFAREDMQNAMRANSELVLRLYRALARAGIENTAPIDDDLDFAELPHLAISRATTRFWLRSTDEVCRLFSGDLLTGLIYIGVIHANTSYLNALPGSPYADIDDHVPDSMRRPITAIALAASLSLPRETVRRHVRALEGLGVCRSVKGGLIAPEIVLRQPNMMGPAVRVQANIRLLLNQLQMAGFPPARSSASDALQMQNGVVGYPQRSTAQTVGPAR